MDDPSDTPTTDTSSSGFEDAARALESRDELDGTFELDGQEHPLRILEPTLDELDEIDADLDDDADETDAIREIADRYLIEPDVNVGGLGVSKLFALFDGMRSAWTDADVFEEARDEMPVDQGNSRRSRR